MSRTDLLLKISQLVADSGYSPNGSTHNVDVRRTTRPGRLLNQCLDQNFVVVCAIFTGLISHVLVLRRGEWDRSANRIFWLHVSVLVLWYGFTWQVAKTEQLPLPNLTAARTVCLGFIMYSAAILLSITFYRICLHPLRAFPVLGYAAMSKLYVAWLSVRKWRLHEDIQALHRQHGDVVRIGPTELSIIDPSAISDVYGVQSRCVRGPICNLSPTRYLYAFDRNKATHDAHRRVWYRAFSAKAVHQYDHITAKHTVRLCEYLDCHSRTSVDLSELFRLISFDIMAEIFYGLEPGCLARQQESKIQKLVLGIKFELAVVLHMPWVVALGQIWPFPRGAYTRTCQESDNLVDQALKERVTSSMSKGVTGSGHTRALDYFLEAWSREPDRQQADRVLRGDSDLFLIAGWDNQANMMATTIFLLSQHPIHLGALREELQQKLKEFEAAKGHTDVSLDRDSSAVWDRLLIDTPIMMSALHETMRLFPSLAQGVQRMTPPEGIQLGETFIPGNTIITMPHWSLFRDERSFVDPEEFRPERWTTRPDLVKNNQVFVPFGTGQSPCPGRHLATRMMKHILADLVLKYDFELATHTTTEKVLAGRFEAFNMFFGPVPMVFRPRRVSS